MRGGVKQFLAVVVPQTHSDDFIGSMIDHVCTRKMVQKEEICELRI
jgi:hypothetical protein